MNMNNNNRRDCQSVSPDYAPYSKLDQNDIGPARENCTSIPVYETSTPTPLNFNSGTNGARNPIYGNASATMPPVSNPHAYTASASGHSTSVKSSMNSVKDIIGKWRKKAAEKSKKAEDLAGNMWQHLRTGPSFSDAAMSRIAQGTKILTEGGYEKIFRQTFEIAPEEQLLKAYACYLSTSVGPVMGMLYLSTIKLAFCSDNPFSNEVGDHNEWSYYQAVVPLPQLKAVYPSASKANPSEKYIQIVSEDNPDFWFMSFVQYDDAVQHLQEAVKPH